MAKKLTPPQGKEEDKNIKSDLLEDPKPVEQPQYDEDEKKYIMKTRSRMISSRNARDMEHDEYDGMSYATQYEINERLANTFIKPKNNKEETNFQSGVIRQKLFALLAAINGLDLRADLSAFGEDGFKIQALGDAMEDIMLKTNELDTDDEKKYLRHYELIKQGTVFVEELWVEFNKNVKKTKKKFDGTLKGFDWTTNIKKAFCRPTRNIITGLNVYLGDITKYDISEQPYIFTVDTKPYEEAEAMFGTWERWANVPRKVKRFEGNEKTGVFNYDWTLLQSQQDYVEIVRYQDKWNNEFALFLNGVLMTPVGLPITDIWGYEDYNITQQNFEPIHHKFAYGKSLISRLRNKAAILDEFLKLGILKTQKSFVPPYLNISGKIVSNRVFMPGKITHGIPPNTLIPISDKEVQGVTQSELAMINQIEQSIDLETMPKMIGQMHGGKPTVAEILDYQRQAKLLIGLAVFSISMLEWKLSWLRLKNILANWFSEEDQVVDEVRGELRSKFRKVTTDYNVPGKGMGKRMVIPTKEMPSSDAIMKAEDQLSTEQNTPIRLIFLNPEEVTNVKLIWQSVVTPKERKTSESSKLLFRAFMQDVMALQPNVQYLQEEFSSVWEKNPQKLFAPNPAPQPGAVGPDGQPIETPDEGGAPQPPQPGGMSNLSPRVAMPMQNPMMQK